MNLNKVILVGRLTGDPQLKTTPSGKAVASFSMATNRTWADNTGAKKEAVEFHNIILWGRLAEVAAQYCVKGSVLLVEGRIQTRKWDDKQGVKHYMTEVIGESIQLGPRPQGTALAVPQRPAANPTTHQTAQEAVPTVQIDGEDQGAPPIDDSDLPF